jgi:hypothetical protein
MSLINLGIWKLGRGAGARRNVKKNAMMIWTGLMNPTTSILLPIGRDIVLKMASVKFLTINGWTSSNLLIKSAFHNNTGICRIKIH